MEETYLNDGTCLSPDGKLPRRIVSSSLWMCTNGGLYFRQESSTYGGKQVKHVSLWFSQAAHRSLNKIARRDRNARSHGRRYYPRHDRYREGDEDVWRWLPINSNPP